MYKRIKKKLFLWNNVYSNEEIFFNNNNENVKELKFKLSNHLTKEMTLPLLVPIINIDIYLPFFSKFSKEKMFKSSFEKIHKINLYPYNSFFDDKTHLFCFDNYKFKEINNLEFNVCFIKPIYHDKGFLEINEKEKEIYFFSLPYYIMDNEEKFDKERECCYGSLFNLKKKESKILRYKCISFYNINYYLERYYLFENASIEIFTKDNKSYFFQFEAERKKKIFIEKINKNLENLQILEKKKIIKDWEKGKISNLEYLMKINLLANRTLRDVSLYPVFPWLTKENDIIEKKNDKENLIDLPEKKIEKSKLHNFKKYIENIESKLRPLNTPMGLLEITERAKKRKLNYINMYAISMEQFNESKYNIKFNKKNESDKNVPIYDNDLTVLYNDPNVSFEEIPYIYGSHFSNPAYISHYLIRIFPFTNIGIEIQGNSFDSPDRLFININKSFIGSSTEKGDIRELIPQFFFLPEMFVNLNKFNFGSLQKVGLEKTDSTIFIQNLFNLGNEVNDCLIPYYADNDPYKFIIIYRKVLESAKINIEDWINFIFGEFSYGKKAQDKGNIFMSYCYDGVVEKRIKENKSLKRICCRLNELGCNPLLVFDKIIKRNCYLEVNYPFNIPFKTEEGTFTNIISLNCFVNESTLNVNLIYKNNKLLSCDLQINLKGQICNVSLTQIKDYVSFESNNIITVFKNQQKFIITDYFKICYIYINNFFSKNKTEYIKIKEVITVLTLSKDEEYLFLGTKFGRIIIFNIINEKFQLIKKISAHDKPINFIHDNNILNMFVSCSNDCYINLYLYPNIQLVRVIKLNENFIPHYSFLSSDPLSSIIVYSNSNNKFLCYSLNGKLLLEKNRDDENELFKEKQYNEYNQVFKLPCTVRLNNFNDYLVYFNNDFIVFRKLPFLEIAFYILNQKNKVADNFKVFNIN